MDAGDLTATRIAENESLFRSANEKIEATAESIGLYQDPVPFICECSDVGCTEIVRLRLHVYEELRARPERFFCVPGHQAAAVAAGAAAVVDDVDGVRIVDKVGVAANVARELHADDLLR
jgi:hypothetical protein